MDNGINSTLFFIANTTIMPITTSKSTPNIMLVFVTILFTGIYDEGMIMEIMDFK